MGGEGFEPMSRGAQDVPNERRTTHVHGAATTEVVAEPNVVLFEEELGHETRHGEFRYHALDLPELAALNDLAYAMVRRMEPTDRSC